MDAYERTLSRQSSRSLSNKKQNKVNSSIPKIGLDPDKDFKIIYISMFNGLSNTIKTKQDLNRALILSGRHVKKKKLEELWSSSSRNLPLKEFHNLCKGIKVTSEDDMLRAFKKIDVNNDGFIARDEFFRIMTKMGDKMSQKEAEEFLSAFDDDGDGRLDYEEYITMVLKTQEESYRAAERKYEKFTRGSKSDDYIKTGSLQKHSSSDEGDDNSIIYESGLNNDDEDDDQEPIQSSGKVWSASGKLPLLEKPKKFKDWSVLRTFGTFYFHDGANEDGGLVIKTQHFKLEVKSNTCVWMSVEPVWSKETDLNRQLEKSESCMDIMLFVLSNEGKLVACSDERGSKGKSCLSVDLKKGKYHVMMYTSGSKYRAAMDAPKFKNRKSNSPAIKLVSQIGDAYLMTTAFRDVLCDVFKSFDSRGRGLLGKRDFELYTKLTCGEEEQLHDEDWGIVVERVQTYEGLMTNEGFLELHEMDAMDSQGDEEDFWDTLLKLGYDQKLHLIKASRYLLEISTESAGADVDVEEISTFPQLEHHLVGMAKRRGVKSKSRSDESVNIYVMMTAVDAVVVVENENSRSVSVTVDCTKSENIISHRGGLKYASKVSGKASMMFHHLHPARENLKWSFHVNESVRRQ